MNAAAATTTRQTADERRDAIVVAALHEFAERGYAGTSTESIARAVGVSQPYLFQLFGTKRELFLATVRHGFKRVRLVFHEAATRRPTDDQECSILDLMGAAYMRLLSDQDLLRVQLQAYAACGDDDGCCSTWRPHSSWVERRRRGRSVASWARARPKPVGEAPPDVSRSDPPFFVERLSDH